VDGRLPEGLLLCAGQGVYRAYDGTGAVLWTQPAPGAAGAAPGPPEDPSTAVAATAVARARLAVAVKGDLVLGDAAGLLRLDAKTGEVRWRYPAGHEEAAALARKAMEALRADLARVRAEGETPRRQVLPAYAWAGNAVVRVLPESGVEVVDAGRGAVAELIDGPVEGAPVGPPCVAGQMAAVGWDGPGRVRVYDLAAGKRISEYLVPEAGALLAPPLLDPVGRLYVPTAGGLQILDARTCRRAHETVLRSYSPYAAPLFADGRLLVFHDGAEGVPNLHFIDLSTGKRTDRTAPALLRDVEVVRDGYRLFVFTSTPGLEETGARLSRIDLQGHDVLAYALPPRGTVYGRPLLLQDHVAVLAGGARGAALRLYDREASLGSGAPQPVFVLGEGRESAEMDFAPGEQVRYAVPPAVAVLLDGLVAAHPFGAFRLAARGPR
jgi:hypothetical protein